MGELVNFATQLHKSTTRSYLERMIDDKINCMMKAKEYEFDYWDGDRRFGYGGYKYMLNRWKPVAEELILNYRLDNNSSVLDIGCGKAFLLYEMKKILPGLKVSGFDISKHGIKSAKNEIAKDLFIHKAQETYPFNNDQFDLAISLGCFHNLKIFELQKALSEKLSKTIIGNPAVEGVRMGALAGTPQVMEVSQKVAQLSQSQSIVYGDLENFEVIGANKKNGAFISPILFLNEKPYENKDCHSIEAFGPVSTILPYKDLDEAIELSRMGKGTLVCSIITADDNIAREFTINSASMHGRILVLNKDCAKESTGHGSPMPLLTHGGPGRAGGGEEMGGKRGILRYLQRTAIQGHPTTISKITNQYQVGGKQNEAKPHVFRKHFEELKIGETVFTDTHTVSLKNIEDFAELSGDKFYAHMDENALEGTIFTERVAHGYYILSRAAGLFVDPPKGPVLLNYGIDECRFTKPVYPGMTIAVRFTVKEKIEQEKRPDDDIAKGIVKFLVDVYDDENETVMMATIFGMAFGGWFSGEIFDLTGSYMAAFLNGLIFNFVNMSIAFFLLFGKLRIHHS